MDLLKEILQRENNMLNIEKYKDEILNEYQQRMNNNTSNYSDGTRMNKAIKTIAYKHCGKLLHGASSPFKWLCEEYKEPPILDEVEKEYLRAVIKPFRNRIRCICLDPRSFDYYPKIYSDDNDDFTINKFLLKYFD